VKVDIPVYDIIEVSELKQEHLSVSRFSSYYAAHQGLHKPHRHNFYHILLIIKGEGINSIDFETFPSSPFQMYFMIPGQVHSWKFEGDIDGYVINFSPEFFQSFLLRPDFIDDLSFFRGIARESVILISRDRRKKVLALVEELLNETIGNKRFNLTMARLLLMNLFILIARQNFSANGEVTSSYNYTLLKSFRKLIGQHYKTLKLPKEYAALLYITPNHLNALCNDLLGISAGEVIRNRVMLEAKRLLINPNLTISEISALLNFSDNSYFTKSFKKHVGSTPEEFRKQILKT
jgi:AraC family transcriptional activator of pobA